ncbi:MAG: hypothetical protein NTX50_13055 [Candidatus Sumerlaeota bacterium]|nr:hypothetical protein [Candidatus Sumerlaeota bacterium]
MEFSVVNDSNEFWENVAPQAYEEANYSCGLFVFGKPGAGE